MKLKYEVLDCPQNYQNIKQILKQEFHISNRLISKLKSHQQIYLNNSPAYVTKQVNVNDIVEVSLDFDEDNSNIIPIPMKLDILYEDDALFIINKPPHLPVHPSMNHFENSLSNGVKFYFDTIRFKKKNKTCKSLRQGYFWYCYFC